PKILNNKIKTNLRMRLVCKVYRRHPPVLDPRTGEKIAVEELVSQRHVLNELTVDRGPSPFISNLDLYGDDSLLTVAQADGII
ncbi:NAD(+)/NADH kinase, partial [Brenneria sp. 4F2]|nr:NAD(+)/NADH kinase [Brenneria bubanii]